MKEKTVLVITAHPDDEAFGPSGLIAKLSKDNEVHLVCVTDGASDSRFHALGSKLAPIRKEELRASANVLGVRRVHFLGYKDGSLCNNLYHEVADKIIRICRDTGTSVIVTNELRGVSGHLDHVAVAFIASYVYRMMESIDAILYNATTKETSGAMQDYFVFFPPGYDRGEVDLVVDISDVFDTKIEAAMCHKSQIKDVRRVTERWKSVPKEELYFVTKRRAVTIPA